MANSIQPWFQQGLMKTHHCGQLNEKFIGESVILVGWMQKYRDLGGLHFIDLRDKYGVIQLSFENYSGDLNLLKSFSLESVLQCKGVIRARPTTAINEQMNTGKIEVLVSDIQVLSIAERVPFLPHGATEANEDLKLKYRYIDLRSKRLQDILSLRSQTAKKIRETLYAEDFTEVETPILYKTTPEGARDYIVPSRVHKSKVYALPQSPQTLKQLLMIASTDRYFQICKCFRDEDLRADRQPEFTQVDIEVSYGSVEYLKQLAEKILKNIFSLPKNFELPVMTYDQAMQDYGSDKPDLRFGLVQMNVTNLFKDSSFATFKTVSEKQGLIKAMFVPQSMGVFARKVLDELPNIIKPYGGKGVAWFKSENKTLSGGISKFITSEVVSTLSSKTKENTDSGTWFFIADESHKVVHDSSDALRRFLGRELKLIDENEYKFAWIIDFPLFEYDQELKRLFACHHPFTMPKLDNLDKFFSKDLKVVAECKAQAYDLVCNGYEIAGGSQRIFDSKVQAQMFDLLGLSQEEVQQKFGFFIEALKYGTPPHGGMAFGFDRLMMLIAKTDNIRDVIAFPKTASASDLMAQAPSAPSAEQLDELGMSWVVKK
jgi:aspartyl-tRNA synthetase